jgi:hypothetical protein
MKNIPEANADMDGGFSPSFEDADYDKTAYNYDDTRQTAGWDARWRRRAAQK